MKTRIAALLLAITMTLSFTACSPSNQAKEPDTTSTPAITTSTEGNESTAAANTGNESSETSAADENVDTVKPVGYNGIDNLVVSEEPITVTMFYYYGPTGAPKGDMPVWKEIEKITNVSMENVASESIAEFQPSLNTMLASGELPDIIHGPPGSLGSLIEQGAFLPLDDLIEQYAPNIKRFLSDFEVARIAGLGTNGQFYTITGTQGGEPGKSLPSIGFFIRQDWLEKLNLPSPTTFDEFKNVLYAFRNNDPNGNGVKDEIPFFQRDKQLHTLYQLWGANRDWYVDKNDGKVHHGKIEQEYKNAMKELAQWYADGVIDPEIFTRGSQARQILLGNDTGGATVDWFTSTGDINDAVRETVPNINFVAIAPPADITGVVKTVHSRLPVHGHSWGISKDCKDPVAVIKFLDFFFTETGNKLANFGVEGEHYNIVNGEVVLSQEALTFPSGFNNFQRSIGAGYEFGCEGNMMGEFAAMNDIARNGFEIYLESDWILPPFPNLSFTEEEFKILDDNMSDIQARMDEYEQSALMSIVDIDATWDSYVNDLMNMNLASVLEAYNNAYARYVSR